jgi:Skp family chaperone for outer membrane proteins
MIFRSLILIVGILLGTLTGCNRDGAPQGVTSAPKPAGGVGVVDLDSLAKQLGRDVEMNNAVQERLTSLNSKLTTFQNSLNRLFDEKKETFGEEPNEEQQKQLAATQDRMTSQLLESKRKGENELAVYKQQLVDQFREQTKPVLREVAAARGLSIVVPKNNLLLLTVDPGVEITDEVAKRMLASQPPTSEPSAEKPRRRGTTETSSR